MTIMVMMMTIGVVSCENISWLVTLLVDGPGGRIGHDQNPVREKQRRDDDDSSNSSSNGFKYIGVCYTSQQ